MPESEPFTTLEEFTEALGALMARAHGLDPGEVEAELQGQIMVLRDKPGALWGGREGEV